MALPSNDDFANCELSGEELEAIAAGISLGHFIHSIGHELNAFFTNPVVAGIAGALVLIGGGSAAANSSSATQRQ